MSNAEQQRRQEFVAVYHTARVDDQHGYYERNAATALAASRQILTFTAVVLFLTSIVGFVAGLDLRGKVAWAVVAAVLPAITTALAAYGALYSFDRIAKLYADAATNLDLTRAPTGPLTQDAVKEYVTAVEAIFESERGQWGQFASEPPEST